MSVHCPNCDSAVPLGTIEGVRKPLLSVSPAFACPTCGCRLMVNYTHFQTNLFRIAYMVGAIALMVAIRWLNPGLAVATISVLAYVLIGWLFLVRVRRVVSLAKA